MPDICERFEQWEEWDARALEMGGSARIGVHAAVETCRGRQLRRRHGAHRHVPAGHGEDPHAGLAAWRSPDLVWRGARHCGGERRPRLYARGFLHRYRWDRGREPGDDFASWEFDTCGLEGRVISDETAHEPARAALCGASATLCHDAILTPMDVVKQRMQLGVYRNVGECLRTILRHEGLWGFYRSMPTTLAMNVPFGSILVASNESMKQSLGIRVTRQDSSRLLPWYFLSAGLSGAIASAATQPLDVVKTRLQTQDCLVSSASSSRTDGSSCREAAAETLEASAKRTPKYTGFLAAVRTIVREEGWHGTQRLRSVGKPMGCTDRTCRRTNASAIL
ncbi:unnamed protein product [Effrenium voratum]|uniref:Mitochondrial carrier protein n=1 Tax=Effrenium voratum TaxID=2562239 RepID=A0AA36N5C6_9DINO|nr:unnamed protein product [Effrenium voratum]